jgi:CO/xanthine dehydrogenase Mo-binding subunit
MEPPNAIAVIGVDGWHQIWCGTQWPERTAEAVAHQFGWSPKRVILYPERMGGSFGRKEAPDFVHEAVAVAREYGAGPVQLFWSRDDDLQHGYYHPASRHRLAARLERGQVAAWRHRVASPSIEGQWRLIRKQLGVAIPRAEASGAWNPPYAFDDFLVEYVDPPCPIPLGFWRSIEIGNNTFAVECFVDELAHAAGRDPIEFRLAHLGESLVSHFAEQPFDLARLRAVYELAAERSGWGERLPGGRGRGVAGLVFDGVTACVSVADVTVAEGDVRVDRIVCALDCGTVVNPLGLEGNVESALAWGLSALRSEITFAAGHAQQTSPLDYEILRFHQMPAVEIHTVASDEPPSGTGEIPAPTVAPAVFNAIFAATGKRLRRLPLKPGDLS